MEQEDNMDNVMISQNLVSPGYINRLKIKVLNQKDYKKDLEVFLIKYLNFSVWLPICPYSQRFGFIVVIRI